MNKEIEKLSSDICNACHIRKVCTGENCYVAKGIAQELYNAGYRKVPIMKNLKLDENRELLETRFEKFTSDKVLIKNDIFYGVVYFVDKQEIENKGYRKVYDDRFILKHDKGGYCLTEEDAKGEEKCTKCWEQVRKQTAKEILQDLKGLLEGYIHKKDNISLYEFYCKIYEVEIDNAE